MARNSLRYEDDVQAFGRRIFDSMGRKKPSIFARDFWQGQMMDWSMRNEAFKTEMFRFVDVFPVLTDPAEIARHLQEYFCRPGQDFPKAFQWGLSAVKPDSRVAKIAAGQIEKNIRQMAYKFIAGQDVADALPTLEAMRREGIGFTVDLLGEACVSEPEAEAYQRRYAEILEGLAAATAPWAADARVESAEFPRVNVSVKISALYSQLDPIDPEGSFQGVAARLRPILRAAKQRGALVNIDVEDFHKKGLTYDIFMRLLEEPEFDEGPRVGVVVQAYLKESEQDLRTLIKWAKKKKKRVTIRLVKGAYWDYEVVHAQQNGWPIPVYVDKRQTDENYEELTALLMDSAKLVIPAIASHNVRSLAHAMASARRNKLGRDDFEFQMLYGMAEPLKAAIIANNFRLRDYVPIGELVPGMAYLVRRLLENTSNESWLRKGFAEETPVEQLLADPRDRQSASTTVLADPAREMPSAPGFSRFFNEPLAHFAIAEHRESYRAGLATVEKKVLGQHWPLVIGGQKVDTAERLTSLDPAEPARIVGTTASATVEAADRAIEAARAAFPAWRDTAPTERARYLVAAAAEMRKRRFELAAVMTYECGKQWREADADVCEAIDFCEYYAREMVRLGTPQRLGRVPGELDQLLWEPRGVTAVIAPWNFPLAILTGMATAALVAGNTVVMKPAEQSPIIAALLMDVFEKVKLPAGVLNFLPGRGEVVGARLVESPHVPIVVFTGSMEVGLQIYAAAGRTDPRQVYLKRMICELGGKNAIIVDSDADLDEAVDGVLKSAFGYQGQKCSACSRAIVLENNYDIFVERLSEAVRSIAVGPARDPRFKVGPVVDAEAHARILRTLEKARADGHKLAVQATLPADTRGGYYVAPTVFVDVDPQSSLAQDEIFGPVLAVIKARDFDHALEIANSTRYALTGGVFSRSPENIEKTRQTFRVGNLYINRGCTGALVFRQPFGGSRMSGVGSKAGGPDYLKQFMDPRAITENTMRRGFTPEGELRGE